MLRSPPVIILSFRTFFFEKKMDFFTIPVTIKCIKRYPNCMSVLRSLYISLRDIIYVK